MKNFVMLLFLVLSSTTYGFYMHANGLQNTGEDWYNFATMGFTEECESFYGYTRHTIECSYQLEKSYYGNDRPSDQPFEITMVVDLPQDAIVTGAWLKLDEDWLQALPFDVLEAEEMYEDLPYTLPRFLFRELVSVNYNGIEVKTHQINLGPVYYHQPFSLKFTYISQNIIDINAMRQLVLLDNYLINYILSDITFTIKFLDHDYPDSRPVSLDGQFSFTKSEGWWETTDRFRDASGDRNYSDVHLKWDRAFTSEPEFRLFSKGDKQYYHYMMQPPVTPQDRQNKRVLLLYDLGSDVPYTHSRSAILDKLRRITRLTLAPTDSINMIYIGDFMPLTMHGSFMPATPGNIDDLFDELKSMTSVQISGLPQLMRAAKDYFNASWAGGELWILSNAQDHCDPPSVANEIMQLSYYQLDYPVRHNIFDCRPYNDYYHQISFNGQTYYGNDYLYQNLARMSGGGMLNACYIPQDDLELEIAEVFAPAADLVKVDVIPDGGYTYTKYDLNHGKTHYPITYPIQELGCYEGTPPLETVFNGQVDGETLRKSVTVQDTIGSDQNQYMGPIWNASYLTDLLKQPQSFATIEKIAGLSQEYEILTPYCGFVIPSPSGYKGYKRLVKVDTTFHASEGQPEEPVTLPEDFTLGAYPNPFNAQVTIQFDLPPVEVEQIVEIRIYDVLGRMVREFKHTLPASEYRLNIRWDGTNDLGSQVGTGLYVVQCRVGSVTQTIKITYLK